MSIRVFLLIGLIIMARLVKSLTIVLASLLLLAVVIAIGLVVFVNPNKFKPQISQFVHAKTGRELQINGDISWTFFPRLGLKVADVQLGNPADFPKQAFAKIQEAEVNLALFPLLKKHIVADKLSLRGLQLNLIKNQAGATNWQIVLAATATSDPQTIGAKEAAAAPLFLNIGKIQIIDAGVNYLDQQTNKQFAVRHLQFDSQNVGFGHPFPINLKFQANSQQPAIKGDFSAKGNINLDPERQDYQLNPFDLAIDLTGDNLPHGKVNITANAAINMGPQIVSVKPLKIVLDKQTTVTGAISKNLQTQLLSFNLSLPELTLPASTAPAATASATTKSVEPSSVSTALLPLALLKDLKANGGLQIDKFKADKLELTNIKVNLNADNGIVRLAPIEANLYQGSYRGQINIDTSTNMPNLSTQQILKSVQLGQLLTALGKQSKFPLSGTGDVTLQLRTLGNDKNSWVRNLNGNANFAVSNGTLENINLEYQLQRIRSFINREPTPKQQGANQTTFDSLTGSFHVVSGVASNSDLLLQSKTIKVKGQGKIDLPDQTLDYRIQTSATSQNLGQDVYKIQDYLGGSLPIVISGKWDDPKVEPDWKEISQAIAKAVIKQQAQKIKDRISDELDKNLSGKTGEQLKQTLEGLFK